MKLKRLKRNITFRSFLFNPINKEFLIFLFFLALSSIFWLLLTLNETYEAELRVPLRLTGVPQNVVVTSEPSDTVRVTVKDKGFVLLTYFYSHRLRPLKVRFDDYANEQNGTGRISLADLQKQIYAQLHSSSRITATRADALGFYFNYGESKRVPVRLTGRLSAGGSYYLSQVKFTPQTILVYASRHRLDSIKYVSTEDISIRNIQDTISRQVSLQKIAGAKFVPSSVRMDIYPDILTEETVDVPITAVNMPADKVLRTFPSHVTVHFIVGASLYRTIRPEQFSVVADYNEIAAHPSAKCSLHLRAKPHVVVRTRLSMQEVDYLIEQR